MNQISYNRVAEQWAQARNHTFVSQLVIGFVAKLPAQSTILDIGCGTGFPLAHYIASQGHFIWGIDFAEKMIEQAQAATIPNAHFEVADFFQYEPQKTFDGILAWDSFWHFPRNLQEHLYLRVATLTKSGGYVLFTHGNVDGEHIDSMMGESFYYSALPTSSVITLLHENGFDVLFCQENLIENNTHRALVVLAQKR